MAEQLRGLRYDTLEPVVVSIGEGRIADVQPRTGDLDEFDPPVVAPGLVDLQVNGFGGREFTDSDLTIQAVGEICRGMVGQGVTQFLPTCTTQSFAVLARCLRTIAEACGGCSLTRSMVAGIHLEGPYISAEDGPRGAHPREHVRPPDWDEFQRLQDASAGLIRLITLSPEYPQAVTFVRRAVDAGLVVAIGHTQADTRQLLEAVDAGAKLSTHLGNGAHGMLRRHPNYIWDQLAEDRLSASLIADGHHLPAAVLKSLVRGKTPQRCLLVSDVTGLGGMPPGRYRTGLGDVEVLEDGRLVIAGQRQYLAGAALPLRHGVGVVMRDAGLDLSTALELATHRPRELMGLPSVSLSNGDPADLVRIDLPIAGQPLGIQETWIAGQCVFRAEPDLK